MSKHRLHLSRIFAFAILLTLLAIPVSAAELDFYPASSFVSFAPLNEMGTIIDPIAKATYYPSASALSIKNKNSFHIYAPDKEFTLTNISDSSKCYIVLSYQKYTATTAKEIRENYKDKIANPADLADLPAGDAPIYFAEQSARDIYYLTNDGSWRNGLYSEDVLSNGGSSAARQIRKGETVTFTLPDAKEDDIYSIALDCYYTEKSGNQAASFSSVSILIDTDKIYPSSGSTLKKTDYTCPAYENLEFARRRDYSAHYNTESKTLLTSLTTLAKCAAPDQKYTINNTGNRPLTIFVRKYELKPASYIRQEYSKTDIKYSFSEDFPTDDTPVHLFVQTTASLYFLSVDNELQNGFASESSPKIRRVQPGESVTFTLPDAESGMYYQIYVEPEDKYALIPYEILITDKKEAPGAIANFTDVPTVSYYTDAVTWAVRNGITTGTSDTTFSPADTCINAQILTFLWRAKGEPAPTISNPFTDVSESNYYYKAALWAYENGLVTGNTFLGNTPCTRAMTVTYIWKLAGKPESKPSSFADVDPGAEYAAAVDWAVSESITNGTSDTTFSPDTICTRSQIVTLLHRALGS